MVKRLTSIVLMAVVLLVAPSPAASTDSIVTACQDPALWLSDSIPDGLLELVCSVQENGTPVGMSIEADSGPTPQEEDSATEMCQEVFHCAGLPEEIEQQLLFLLILWGRQQ